MAFSLRLPDHTDQAARVRAEALGVSMNSLVCVAVDFYLAAGRPRPGRMEAPLPVYVKRGPVPAPKTIIPKPPRVSKVASKPLGSKPSKAERRAFTAQARALRKSQGSLDLG